MKDCRIGKHPKLESCGLQENGKYEHRLYYDIQPEEGTDQYQALFVRVYTDSPEPPSAFTFGSELAKLGYDDQRIFNIITANE
ncbi:MAG: hypothetical protein RSF78_11195 [Bacteroidales bacterium]